MLREILYSTEDKDDSQQTGVSSFEFEHDHCPFEVSANNSTTDSEIVHDNGDQVQTIQWYHDDVAILMTRNHVDVLYTPYVTRIVEDDGTGSVECDGSYESNGSEVKNPSMPSLSESFSMDSSGAYWDNETNEINNDAASASTSPLR